jgi:hypothetical protein
LRRTRCATLGHHLHVRPAQAQFLGNLPVGEVQPHEVEAQDPHPQRLVVAGQHGPGEVVEAGRTCLATIPLPVPLSVVTPVANNRAAATARTANPLWPAMLAQQRKALRVVQ